MEPNFRKYLNMTSSANAQAAAGQHDPIFNLLSIKHKFLLHDICHNCQQTMKEWVILNDCHHIMCNPCQDVVEVALRCRVCFSELKQSTNIKPVKSVKVAYSQMEELVFNILAIDKGTLGDTVLVPKQKNKEIEENFNCTELSNSQRDNGPQQSTDSSCHVSQSLMEMFGEVNEIQFPHHKVNNKEKSNGILPVCLNSNSNKEKKENNINKKKQRNYVRKKLDDSNIVAIEKSQHQMKNMSFREQSNDNSSESEEDVIAGTPEKCHISNLGSSQKQKNKKMFISYTSLETKNEIEVLNELAEIFGINVITTWNDCVTHLVVKTDENGLCTRTRKYVYALLSNCFIVSFEWVINCYNSSTLLPELDYIPYDTCGEPSPIVSWRVGRGIIDSPMEWTKNCILYLHNSVEHNDLFRDIINWAKKAGFVLINKMEELRIDEFKMRIILAAEPSAPEDTNYLPSDTEMTNWMYEYKAVTVYLEWFLECLFRYRFVEIAATYQVRKLDSNMVAMTEMDECLFEFE